ncbi:MAG: NmrA family NAD(P)-binding protein [Bacteroidota bacterium]
MDKILLFNATGAQGTTISHRLLEKDYKVISPVRSEKNISILHERNIEAFLTDFSIRSLLPIIEKADKVVLQIPAAVVPDIMAEIASNAIDAISMAGNPKTVFVISSTIPKLPIGVRSVDVRLKMVELARGKMPDTPILSSTEYLENFSTAYRQPIMENGVIPQTIPPGFQVNYLSWSDLAAYVLAALESDKLTGGKVYQIGGNRGMNGIELAERMGRVLGKQLAYVPISHKQLEKILTPIMGAEVAKDYAEFYHWQDTEGASLLNPDTEALRNLLSVNLPSFEVWAERAFFG